MNEHLPEKGIYRHFKGKRYELIDFATHSETMETMVVYRALYGEGGLWVRPLSMWSERVERDGRVYTRFLPEEEWLRLQGTNEAGAEFVPPPEEAPPEDAGFCPPPEDGWDWAGAAPPFSGNSAAAFPENDRDFTTASPGEARNFTAAPANDAPKPVSGDKLEVLKRVYGYESFREGQAEVIDAILAGRDALAILPTGAGKSLCYQIPAQLLPGVAVVISPLISLMKDQVEALTQAGVAAAYLNSSLSERQFDLALRGLAQGKYKLVYVAPERLLTPRFLGALAEIGVSLVAVDEAHCISQWGQDFRPSYLQIPDFIDRLGARPRVCAFTATATERVRSDVTRLLRLRNPFVLVTGFDRPNLYFSVSRTREKDAKLMELAASYRGFSGIVYCATRKGVEAVCERLQRAGFPATRYHAGLSEEERRRNQEDFIYDRAPLMVATNAFGMGIDKSNVRFVIHYNMPKDLESYYQEAGRAGRDGERADCHLLFEPRDVMIQKYFIERMGEEAELSPEELAGVQEAARFRLNAMADYCQTAKCLRRTLLHYFGEERAQDCGYCANCLAPEERADVTEIAMQLVECVRRSGGRYGVTTYIRALRGSRDERVLSSSLVNLPQYGALKDVERMNLRLVVDALVEEGVLEITAGDYPLLRCGARARELLDGQLRVYAHQDAPRQKSARKAAGRQGRVLSEDIDHALFELLRGVRTKLARERNVAPYVICNDATLIDMCRRMPTDAQAMLAVYGMGERKVRSYGAAFAQAILDYQARGR